MSKNKHKPTITNQIPHRKTSKGTIIGVCYQFGANSSEAKKYSKGRHKKQLLRLTKNNKNAFQLEG